MLWHTFSFGAQSVSRWHENEVFLLFLAVSSRYALPLFFILQELNDLRDIGVVPLASEFEDLIDVLSGGAKPSGVLVLVLNVNFYFKNLLVLVLLFWVRNLYTLAQRMVQSDLLDELLEHSFRDVVVSHSVPCHLQLVEIRFRSDDVRSQ